MTERRGLFVFRTDVTGTKCAAECPHHTHDACKIYGGRILTRGGPGVMRHPTCRESESAAREAEVDALQRGMRAAVEVEIERIRRGES